MAPPRTFFLHVMKTAGSSLLYQMLRLYPDEARYPGPALGRSTLESKLTMRHLLACPPAKLATVDLFMPHLPWCAIDAISFDGFTMTLLRHPVRRAVSHLTHLVAILERQTGQRVDARAVYEVGPLREWFLSNHQVRVFGLRENETADWDAAADAAGTMSKWFGNEGQAEIEALEPISMDESHLLAAKEGLAAVDLVGVTEDYPGFLGRLADRTGMRLDAQSRLNEREPTELDGDLQARITADNALEMELYEQACGTAGVEVA